MSEDQDKEFLESVARLQKRLEPELKKIMKDYEKRKSDESNKDDSKG